MYATNYFETAILNLFRGVSFTAPNTVYVGLYLNNPGESGGGTEVSYAGYARMPITFSAPAAMNGGIGIANIGDITFAQAQTAVGNIPFIGVLDSLSGGNMLLYGELTEVISIDAGEAPVIADGEASWWSTGNMANAYKTKMFNLLRAQSCPGFTPYFALYNGDPESGGAELTGTGYERVPITFGAPVEQTSGQMKITNSASVTMNRATSAWGTWNYTSIMDAASGGSTAFKLSRTAKVVRKGLRVISSAGDLGLTVN